MADSHKAYARALELGAQPIDMPTGPMELRLPAIKGIGGAPLYLIDRFEDGKSIYDIDFEFIEGVDRHPRGHGLEAIDHLTHNVYRGRMAFWAGFYERIFNFREIRYFDIKGEYTGLTSRAMSAPDGLIRIPLNEEASKATGQIEEFLMKFNGEGIQHIALRTDDLCASVDALRRAGVPLMSAPNDIYYEMLEERLPGHGVPVSELKTRASSWTAALRAAPRRACCCRSSPRRCSGRCSSSSSSAGMMRDSARVTSRHCSNRSSATRSAAVRSKRRADGELRMGDVMVIDATHDPSLVSWVDSANDPAGDFPIQNLPFGRFREAGEGWRIGVAIGDEVLGLKSAGLVDRDDIAPLLAAPAATRRALRSALSEGLRRGSARETAWRRALRPRSEVEAWPAVRDPRVHRFLHRYSSRHRRRASIPSGQSAAAELQVGSHRLSRAQLLDPAERQLIPPSPGTGQGT